ncbi:hypothetical protein RF11_03705 [Thelohanellus kitauei]|uniref:Uncharacterized protein n=1 Tax=Thelohanellus kitauei TaxID=669202 RepID=A0A0C2MVC4_THEKT|nr:hypothetical protein RF11_03705 [Thelohanellus kitauei]
MYFRSRILAIRHPGKTISEILSQDCAEFVLRLESCSFTKISKIPTNYSDEAVHYVFSRYEFNRCYVKQEQSYKECIAELQCIAKRCRFQCPKEECGTITIDENIRDVINENDRIVRLLFSKKFYSFPAGKHNRFKTGFEIYFAANDSVKPFRRDINAIQGFVNDRISYQERKESINGSYIMVVERTKALKLDLNIIFKCIHILHHNLINLIAEIISQHLKLFYESRLDRSTNFKVIVHINKYSTPKLSKIRITPWNVYHKMNDDINIFVKM